MDDIISELQKFSRNILDLGASINDNRIDSFEYSQNLKLPVDFKEFMRKINGFNLMGTEVYSFDTKKSESIENVYHYEHFEVKIPQYLYLVPFSPDGRGNFYCIDTLNSLTNGEHPVVFWVSNYKYSEEDTPEITHHNFLDWIKEVVIEWTLEDFNYDGSEK